MPARLPGLLLWASAPLVVLAQDPLKSLPQNYRLLFENQMVRVVKVVYAPHEKLPIHDHARNPTVYVYLSDSGPVRFSHAEDHPFSLVRRPQKEGAFRVSPGRIEKHAVENLGDIRTEFLRVELKSIPLGSDSIAFVSHRPFDLANPGTTTEFDASLLCVQRIILAPDAPRQRYATSSAGLLVAFSPVRVEGRRLAHGDVLWTPARFEIAPQSSPVHLLRITPR